MCNVFPTITSCSIPNVGASGVVQVHNGMCVLTQNIINEKIYLVLWFWYAFLGPVTLLYLCYRLITLMFHGVRYSLLYRKIRRKYDDDIQRCLEYVLAKGQLGDWFVLYQLSKNCNPYFFREFIRELAREMKDRPKKSKSVLSSGEYFRNFFLRKFFINYDISEGSIKKGKSEAVDMKLHLDDDDNSSEDSESSSEASSQQLMIKKGKKAGKRNGRKSGKRQTDSLA